jgi:DNA invertase Pin-like site-specific DNA recombinase
MKTALYARVSTNDKGQTCETQLHALREFCKARGWTIVQTYADTGVSGSKERRPQLDALMKDAKRRRFDCVLVYKLDRFGRSTRHLINSLAEFDSLGVAFVSLSDSWDTSTPSGKLLFTVVAAMAEFERSLLVERVHSGIKRAQANGIHCGRPKGEVTVIDLNAAKAKMQAGQSLRATAKELGCSAALLSKRLRATA